MPSKIQTYPMVVLRDPTSAEIAYFLSTRSGDQMVQLVQSIREPAAQATLTASLLAIPPAVITKSALPEKTRKALNAFVGFRCYYILIPIFKPWPMKKLSNPMGIMWEADPNKPLWSLTTKAWSVIRDQIGKDKAPLDQFFRIICPYLNIPSPETYLDCCGWKFNTDDEGSPTLSREFIPSPGAMSAGIADTALSVEDIINYCQSMGYAQEYVSDTESNSPTYLSQSRNQLAGKSTSSTHESRLVARNKRRAKRQTARDVSIAPVLQQQIVEAHMADNLNATYEGDSLFGHSEPVQFYGDLADLLTNHLGQDQQAISGDCTSSLTTTIDPIMAGWTDWGAFRLGADENATLPSLDSVPI
ncbi:MAT1-1-1 [Didymella exigua CBS 183.55]|uniref:Mating-type protein MAT-1 n=1 Tax=Didymella exigua CBS 183.55 TaxID=1150837 RepID=A0A6A5S4F5_9PLEO|nr:MAT1-1-1 [Didymella exigua CBS 183.55]KAF1934334.1 MAT1-1-1 [Didymella exigua CBS 183.55]